MVAIYPEFVKKFNEFGIEIFLVAFPAVRPLAGRAERKILKWLQA